MDNTVPIPKPRTYNVNQNSSNEGICSKKPVPLPRTAKTNCDMSAIMVSEDKEEITNVPSDEKNTVSRKRSFRIKREELKMSLEDAQLKGKFLVENTKKSVRNMLGKRSTVRSSTVRGENSGIKVNRSVSLPAEDIFHSISFHSPLNGENENQEIVTLYEDALKEDCRNTSGAPPPVYPPPPLPDESVYDEVGQHSAISSQSSNCDTYSEQGSDTIYEDVLIPRNAKLRNFSRCDSLVSDCSSLNDNRITSGSESWSYIPSTGIQNEDIYQNASVAGSSDSDGNDVWLRNRMDGEGSVLGRNINEIVKEGSNTCTLSQISDISSLSVRNELYENWEIPTSNDNLPKKAGRNVLTKSVILEFDPLFDISHEDDEAEDNLVQFTLLEDSTNPYGKIKRIVKENQRENSSVESEYLPVPPERFDSLCFQSNSKEVCDVISPGEKKSDDVTAASSGIGKSDDTTTGDPVVLQEPVQNVSGGSNMIEKNRKSALVRWASMKRAIQSMTDRRLSREPKELSIANTQNSVFYESKSENTANVKRPGLTIHLPVHYSGILYRQDRLRNFVQRYCVLSDGHLTCFVDKTGSSVGVALPLNKVLSIQLLQERKVG